MLGGIWDTGNSRKSCLCVCACVCVRDCLYASVNVVLHIILLMQADMSTASSLSAPKPWARRGQNPKQRKSKSKQNPEINALTNTHSRNQSHPYNSFSTLAALCKDHIWFTHVQCETLQWDGLWASDQLASSAHKHTHGVRSPESITAKKTPIKQPWSDTTSAKVRAVFHARRALCASSQPTPLPLHITNGFVWAAWCTLGYCSNFVFYPVFSGYTSERLCKHSATCSKCH